MSEGVNDHLEFKKSKSGVKMSNFIYEGDIVRVVFDKGTMEEEIRKGTVGRVGGYVGLQGPRYPVKYDGKSWVETKYYYTKKRLQIL